jgi:hypothetical protein
VLIEHWGWRGAYLTFAALLAFVAAPLHAFALPRERADPNLLVADKHAAPAPLLQSDGLAFLIVAVAFASFAFIPSALSAHFLGVLGRNGIDAATAVTIGALFGPSQVAARLTEFLFAGNMHPLNIARAAVALLLAAFVVLFAFGVSAPVALIFIVAAGASNGLITIARGTVPLSLFGAAGYGRLIGRIARPSLVMQAMAPVMLALVIERGSDRTALAVIAAFAVVSCASFLAVRRPRQETSH